MKAKVLALKSRLFGGGGTASGVLGGIGSVPNICHSLCMSVVSLLAVFSVTLNILPLMFLQTYQIYFWSGALAFTGASYYFYHKQRTKVNRDRNFLILNSGLLLFGLPFSQVADYMDFFRFIGGTLALGGLFLLIFGKRFKTIYRPIDDNNSRVVILGSPMQHRTTPESMDSGQARVTAQSILFVIVVGGFLVNQYLMYRMGVFGNMNDSVVSTTNSAMKSLSAMKLTPFDVVLAKERMDKNNDGICDVCGMKIEQCIDSGQLDCNMGNNKDAIGILGSQHIHADWKIYINGQPFDWTPFADLHEKQMAGDASITNTSAFMHMHHAKTPEKAGDILHMHATKVPLWLFFRSLGMNLTKDSLTVIGGRVLKNENGNVIKYYVNGENVVDFTDYVFQDKDKILISYGPESDPDIDRQIKSITNFAKDH